MGEGLNIKDIAEGNMMCLHYFGIFKFPLKLNEVHRFNPYRASVNEVSEGLASLCNEKQIFCRGNYYLKEDGEAWITEREEGYTRAMKLLQRSKRYSRIIASFPFVRGIAISGSLSKFYASTHPDIDYFIIAEKDRLWIARSFLHFFKKLTFLTGHQHYFCMNYFIDTAALELEHPNLYSAIEMASLLPVYNKELILDFYNQNQWVADYLPNHPGIGNFSYLVGNRKKICKSIIEKLLNIMAPQRFNRFLMRVTDKKWRKKWRHSGYSEEAYERAFRTSIHISKNHPMDYEKKVMDALPDQINKTS